MSWPLAAFLPVIWDRTRKAARHTEPDTLPPHTTIGDAPSYAFDMFTRGGKAAIRELLKESRPLRQFMAASTPKKAWTKATGLMLFRVEGGLVVPRLKWDEGHEN